jgi:hypothetical protein
MVLVEQDDFDEGDAPEVLTGTSMSFEGGKHEECPGSYDLPEHGDAVVFCMCSCHRVVPG